MVQNDMVMAQKIVSRSIYNFGGDKNFHKASRIYKASNERIQDYCSYFLDKEKILSVIGSGDQILNYIYDNAKEIDAFDISVFPKYFMYLKIAAIKALTREEYIDLLDELRTDYDLVYLSNIIYYIDFDRYKKLLGDINLSEKGVALTYLYKIKEVIFSKFGNEHYKFERIPDSDAYVLTYHK